MDTMFYFISCDVHDGYMNGKGELTEKFNDASQAEKEKLFGKITGINNKLPPVILS